MGNLFQYLDNYIKNNSNQTYGDILSNNVNDKIEGMLAGDKLEIYNYFKESDKQRLLKFG